MAKSHIFAISNASNMHKWANCNFSNGPTRHIYCKGLANLAKNQILVQNLKFWQKFWPNCCIFACCKASNMYEWANCSSLSVPNYTLLDQKLKLWPIFEANFGQKSKFDQFWPKFWPKTANLTKIWLSMDQNLVKTSNFGQFLKPILAKSRNQTNSEQNSDQELPIWRKFGYLWTRIWLKYQILAVFGPKCGQNIKFWEVDLTKKLLTDLFIGEINFTEKWANNNICCFCDQKFREINVTTLLWQKFRENNVFTTEDTKQLIWRNFLMGDSKFFIFPHCALLLCDQKFREINVITKLQSTLHFIWFDGFFLHRIFHEETE